MELIQKLLLFYTIIILINIALMSTLWFFYRKNLYLYGVGLWSFTFVNFLSQGIFDKTDFSTILAFSSYYLCSLILAKIMSLTTEIMLKFWRYHVFFGVALLIGYALNSSQLGFTISAIPIAIAVAYPMLESGIRCFIKKETQYVAKIYAVIILINAIHFLDYPFLRPMPELALIGFSTAFVLVILLSIYLPIFTSKTLSDVYAKKLEDEIEHRIEIEHDLRIAKEDAETATKVKIEFMANISHELRTPMHAILGFSRLGGDKDNTANREKLLEYFNNIDQSGSRLLLMLNDILDLSKLEANKTEFNFVKQDLEHTIQAVISELSIVIDSKKVIVELENTEFNLDATFDKEKIFQVVSNLLSNAIKFNDEGKKIEISFRETTLPNNRSNENAEENPAITVYIADQGIGIPEDELEIIFDKFIQSSRTNVGAGGTGLGLAICKEIIDGHHGRIWAERNDYCGATIAFTLPKDIEDLSDGTLTVSGKTLYVL